MTDEKLISLYWERDENAIPCTERKYGADCRRLAGNLLSRREDAEGS